MLRFPRDIQLSGGSLVHSSKKKIVCHSYLAAAQWETYPQKVLFFESMCAFCQKGIADKTLDKTAEY